MKKYLLAFLLMGCVADQFMHPVVSSDPVPDENECGSLSPQQCRDWKEEQTKTILRNADPMSREFYLSCHSDGGCE